MSEEGGFEMGGLVLKAYECFLRGFNEGSIIHARTASKARYSLLLQIGDSYPSATFKDVTVRRATSRDIRFPSMPAVAGEIGHEDRNTILHAFGGGVYRRPDYWGTRRPLLHITR